MGEPFDLAVIGAGPAGHVAAERAGALGKRVLVAERAQLGGVCLNQGCIPTKTLLASAKLYAHALAGASMGVTVEGARYDIAKAMAWKGRVVDTLRKGIAWQFRRHKVEVASGTARIAGRGAIEVDGKRYQAANILVATGSAAATLPVDGRDLPHVIGSTEALELPALPRSVAIVGGGYIGMEFATYFARLGVKVSVIEMLPEVVPLLDPEIAALLRRSLPDVDFHLGAKVLACTPEGVRFHKSGAEQSVQAEKVLVAVGRRPMVDGLGLEALGVEVARQGVRVDERMRTNVPGVWAAGDVTGRSMLAHAASRMAEVAVAAMFADAPGEAAGGAATRAAAGSARVNWDAIPWVVYTDPEVAGVGISEAQGKARGRAVKVAKLDLKANGRFVAESPDTRGMCKVVVDAASGVLAGMQMIGPYASEIVVAAAAMIEAELRVRDIRDIVFPHPTVSEALRDALTELGDS